MISDWVGDKFFILRNFLKLLYWDNFNNEADFIEIVESPSTINATKCRQIKLSCRETV